MRAIEPLQLPSGISPASVSSLLPEARLVPPLSLIIDEKYQRDLSERSIRLIFRIVSGWSWEAFKPPICVDVDGALHIVDGQHTAIAAATHGDIPLLPIMVLPEGNEADRAIAFVRHNRDRISVTATQLHVALVAAGDEDAMTIRQVCERAGVTILRNAPPTARYAVGETMSISAIGSLINRRHAAGARKVLETLVKGGGGADYSDVDPRRRASFLCRRVQGRDRRRAHCVGVVIAPLDHRWRGGTYGAGTQDAAVACLCFTDLHSPKEGA